MNNQLDIQLQIGKLQKQKIQKKAQRLHKTVADICKKTIAHRITVSGLQLPGGTKRKFAAPRKSGELPAIKIAGTVLAAKHRGAAGQSWNGSGLTQRGSKTLLGSGQTREMFQIKS